MVPKSRTLKGSRPPLKPFKVHYDTFFFSEQDWETGCAVPLGIYVTDI
jgi:hypothetical protein